VLARHRHTSITGHPDDLRSLSSAPTSQSQRPATLLIRISTSPGSSPLSLSNPGPQPHRAWTPHARPAVCRTTRNPSPPVVTVQLFGSEIRSPKSCDKQNTTGRLELIDGARSPPIKATPNYRLSKHLPNLHYYATLLVDWSSLSGYRSTSPMKLRDCITPTEQELY